MDCPECPNTPGPPTYSLWVLIGWLLKPKCPLHDQQPFQMEASGSGHHLPDGLSSGSW